MSLIYFSKLKNYIIENKYNIIKTSLLCLSFFIVLGCYSLIKDIKDSAFIFIVGKEQIPNVKTIALFLMIPMVLFFSFLSNYFSRKNLVSFYIAVYGIGGIICAYFLNHPTIGLANPIASHDRIFGWILYLFLEGYNPFVVSLLWSFLNSISQPEDIKTNYIYVIIASKLGGILLTGLAWLYMARKISFFYPQSDLEAYIFIMRSASIFILFIIILINAIFYILPSEYLTGYGNTKNNVNNPTTEKGSESGIKLLFKHSYVFGIFGMLFFWEIVNVIFNYIRLTIGLNESESIADFSVFLYKNTMIAHSIGLLISLFGTSFIIRFFGERISLMLIPLLTGSAIIICLFYKTSFAVIITYAFIRAVHYSFSNPLREALYIPTINSIKFKSKSWIESFGGKFAKTCGSFYNNILLIIPSSIIYYFQFSFFIIIIILWSILAYLLGKKWENTIKNGEIIGEKN